MSEKVLIADELAKKNETSIISSCPSFSTLFSTILPDTLNHFLPKDMNSLELDGGDSEDDDDRETYPDLPYVVTPTTLQLNHSEQDVRDKLLHLRVLMKKYGVAVYIVPLEDEHQLEYTALADRRREFISGFTGSAGIAIITLDDGEKLTGEAALSTDGRYFLQAEKQLDSKHWKLLKQGAAGYPSWKQYAIDKALGLSFSNVISVDPRLISVAAGEFFDRIRTSQYQNKFEFKPILLPNLIDLVWGDAKPIRSKEPVYHLPIKFTGEHANEKVHKIREHINAGRGSSATFSFVVSSLDDVAWLMNLRSDDDIPFSPVFFSYLIITEKDLTIYIDLDKITAEIREYFGTINGLVVKNYEDFYPDLSYINDSENNSNQLLVLPSKSTVTYALVSSISDSIVKSKATYESVIANTKIVKNSTELFNARIAQYKDSLAFIIFLAWLEKKLLAGKKITEYQAACKIYDIRSKFPNFKGLSYETISSTGANAAIIHYAPTPEENEVIDPKTPYLIDSGAHYLEGTTDITRTYMFGKYAHKNENYKKWYSLVLKGHLSVALAKFPPGSSQTGTILDSYARQPLWNEGLDFNHGTGHGVGAFGNVHESPLYISTTSGGPNSLDLFKPGGIVTDEPGYYVDGHCGFRIESELEIITCKDKFGKTRSGDNFLGFGYMTKVPFCRALIDKKYLSALEIEWIDDFHGSVFKEFEDKLLQIGDKRAYRWLKRETSPL